MIPGEGQHGQIAVRQGQRVMMEAIDGPVPHAGNWSLIAPMFVSCSIAGQVDHTQHVVLRASWRLLQKPNR